ncbi:hypothetical protein GCM10027612_23380 [Microbispora bryophytorum subsp. camponoti]
METSGRPGADDMRRLFLGPPPVYTRRQVAEAAGIPQDLAARIWRALGFATFADDAVAFTDADLEALHRIRDLLDAETLDERSVIRMARALGRNTARLAEWQAEIMVDALIEPGARPGSSGSGR